MSYWLLYAHPADPCKHTVIIHFLAYYEDELYVIFYRKRIDELYQFLKQEILSRDELSKGKLWLWLYFV